MINMRDTRTKVQRNRAIRQDALREQLASKGLVQHVLVLADKINNAEDALEIAKYKAAAEITLKLINKFLPDLKSTELSISGQLDVGPVDDIKPVDWALLRQARQEVAKTTIQ